MKILDAHNHLGKSVAYGELSAKDQINQMDEAGVAKAVVFPAKWTTITLRNQPENIYINCISYVSLSPYFT